MHKAMLVLPATKDTFNILLHKVGIYKIRVYPISKVVFCYCNHSKYYWSVIALAQTETLCVLCFALCEWPCEQFHSNSKWHEVLRNLHYECSQKEIKMRQRNEKKMYSRKANITEKYWNVVACIHLCKITPYVNCNSTGKRQRVPIFHENIFTVTS